MALAAILFMFIAIILGISLGSWDIAMYGVIPLGIGLFFGFIGVWQQDILEEELRNDPEKAKRVNEILRKYR